MMLARAAFTCQSRRCASSWTPFTSKSIKRDRRVVPRWMPQSPFTMRLALSGNKWVLPQISHLVRSFHSSRRIYETASAVKLPPEKELLAAFEFFQLKPQAEVPMSEAKAAWMSELMNPETRNEMLGSSGTSTGSDRATRFNLNWEMIQQYQKHCGIGPKGTLPAPFDQYMASSAPTAEAASPQDTQPAAPARAPEQPARRQRAQEEAPRLSAAEEALLAAYHFFGLPHAEVSVESARNARRTILMEAGIPADQDVLARINEQWSVIEAYRLSRDIAQDGTLPSPLPRHREKRPHVGDLHEELRKQQERPAPVVLTGKTPIGARTAKKMRRERARLEAQRREEEALRQARERAAEVKAREAADMETKIAAYAAREKQEPIPTRMPRPSGALDAEYIFRSMPASSDPNVIAAHRLHAQLIVYWLKGELIDDIEEVFEEVIEQKTDSLHRKVLVGRFKRSLDFYHKMTDHLLMSDLTPMAQQKQVGEQMIRNIDPIARLEEAMAEDTKAKVKSGGIGKLVKRAIGAGLTVAAIWKGQAMYRGRQQKPDEKS